MLLRIAITVLLLSAMISRAAGAGQDRFAGPNLTAGATFLETGSGSALVRTNFQWSAPTNLSHPAILFAFGFATDEAFAPAEFFDAVSITVRNADRSFVAPVLTADVFGLTAAPENPDGSQFGEKDVLAEPLQVLDTTFAALRSQQSFLILVSLPPALAGQTGTLGVSLFDNFDGERSLAFINHIAVVPGPGTFMVVESSASVTGPYAVEGGLSIRHARRCISLPRPGAHRFYRLRAGSESRIASMISEGSDWLFRYTGGTSSASPVLESSAQAAGPYAVESGVAANVLAHTLRVPQSGVARFFRIHSEIPLTVQNLSMEANQLVISYEEPQH